MMLHPACVTVSQIPKHTQAWICIFCKTFCVSSWILRPPTAESKCTGHERSESQYTGDCSKILVLIVQNGILQHFIFVQNGLLQHLSLQGQVSATYVPSHLHHILFEIFKNSMRATCEFSEKKGLSELPMLVLLPFNQVPRAICIFAGLSAKYSKRKKTSP